MTQRYKIRATCYDKKGSKLSTGFNSYVKTHPLQKYFACRVGHTHKEYLHAEIAAILKAKDKKIHRIVVERFDKHGLPLLAKPCPICSEAIKAYGIKVVEFTSSK
jgi:tRNA(Arg) A34 adenosine deaminase TadA